ncbi:uncharacterized protein LOC142231161 [Haematobia irritans]|uniref:uncharacterized protein LOC142231161 n=1 Tax=Haematobia irritans TaxID=7368 RepID=UPI003F4F9D78
MTNKYFLDIRMIDKSERSKWAPWTFLDVNIDVSLSYCKKMDMSLLETEKRYLEAINTKFKDYIRYYTDGSVINQKAGFAIISDDIHITRRIPDFSSIYTCELSAIRDCLRAIQHEDVIRPVLILTDSKSSLEGMSDPFSKNTIIQDIRTIISKTPKRKIVLMWVPSHLNIKGNEVVDRLAKNSLLGEIDNGYKFQHNDYKRQIKAYIYDTWNELWQRNSESKLYSILRSVPHEFSPPILPRADLVKLNRGQKRPLPLHL